MDSSTGSKGGADRESPTPAPASASAPNDEPDFSSWLQYNRRKRELSYQIGQGFKKIRGQFSYLRLQGITRLLTVLLRLSKQDLGPLQVIQNEPELNVAQFLMDTILAPLTPPELSPITDQEIQRALDALQGVCLMHAGSKKILRACSGLEVVIGFLSSPQPSIQISALDALLSACLDSNANQRVVVEQGGVAKAAELLKDRTTDAGVRQHAAEFLGLFAFYLDEVAQEEGLVDYRKAASVQGTNRNVVVVLLGDAIGEKLSKMVGRPSSSRSSPSPGADDPTGGSNGSGQGGDKKGSIGANGGRDFVAWLDGEMYCATNK